MPIGSDKSVELLFSYKVSNEQEFIQNFSGLIDRMSQMMGAIRMPNTSGLVDATGRPMSSGAQAGAASPHPNVTTTQAPPPPPGAVGMGTIPGAAYAAGMPPGHIGSSVSSYLMDPLYEANLGAFAGGSQAKGYLALKRAGIAPKMGDEDIEMFRGVKGDLESAMRTGYESMRELSATIRESKKGSEEQLKALNRLSGTLETIEKAGNRVADINSVLPGGGSPMLPGLLGMVAGAGLFAAGLPLRMGRREAMGAELGNFEGRSFMAGDYQGIMADQMLGGFASMRDSAENRTLLKAISKIVAAGVGAGALGSFGGIGGMVGGAIVGAGGAAINEFVNFRDNVASDVQTQRANQILKSKEMMEAMSSAIPFAVGGFQGARSAGSLGFADFLTNPGSVGWNRYAISPMEAMGLKRNLLGTMGSGAADISTGALNSMAQLYSSGALPNVANVMGGFYRGGFDTEAVSGLAGGAYGFMDRTRIAPLFENAANQAGIGLGAGEGAYNRLGGVLALTEGYGDKEHSGQFALAAQQQQSNLLRDNGLNGWLGILQNKDQIEKLVGKKLGLKEMNMIRQLGATANESTVRRMFGSTASDKDLAAATRLIQNNEYAGNKRLAEYFGGDLGEMVMMNQANPASLQDYLDVQQGGYDKLMNGMPSAKGMSIGKDLMARDAEHGGGTGRQFYAKEIELASMKVTTGLNRLGDLIPALVAAIQQTTEAFHSMPNSTPNASYMPH